MVMYSKFTYGSQFSGEKKIGNPVLGCRDIKQKRSLLFLGHPLHIYKVWHQRLMDTTRRGSVTSEPSVPPTHGQDDLIPVYEVAANVLPNPAVCIMVVEVIQGDWRQYRVSLQFSL